MVMEDSPLFNSAHGAALNAHGQAELDAAVMRGTGEAGAVAGVRTARNPIQLARAVMEQTSHVLLIDPDDAFLTAWGIETVDRDYFITPARVAQLARLQSEETVGAKHGTVGAVARDAHGQLAAATSTGGTANQFVGRVGDTPIIGSGTWADNDVVAISCTGQGEFFMRQVTAHDIHARMTYGGADLRTAVEATMADLGDNGGLGGLIAIDAEGNGLLSFNSEGMFCGFLENGELRTHV
jgi:beta-aspartyl-peptidase (threonine type)